MSRSKVDEYQKCFGNVNHKIVRVKCAHSALVKNTATDNLWKEVVLLATGQFSCSLVNPSVRTFKPVCFYNDRSKCSIAFLFNLFSPPSFAL